MTVKITLEAANETADPDGFHRSATIAVDHTHFNVLKIVHKAKQDYIVKFTGRIPKHFYAPEALLYLIDKALKDMAESMGQPIPQGSFITNVYNMELHPAEGTCVTLTEEEIVDTKPEPTRTFIVPGAVGQA